MRFLMTKDTRLAFAETACARRACTEDRRAAIAGAARQLIAEKGFEGLRTRDIAERVGINIATLHYHVPSKEALIGLVVQSVEAEFAEQTRAHPRDRMTPPKELEQEIDDFVDMVENRPQLLTVLSELNERGRRDAFIADRVRDMHADWIEQVAGIMERGAKDGSLAEHSDPRAAAVIFLGGLLGALKLARAGNVELRVALATLQQLFNSKNNKKDIS